MGTIFIICLCILQVTANYIPGNVHNDLQEGSTVTSNADCKGHSTCEASFTESECQSLGVCTLACPSDSRTAYPSLTVLTSTTECQDADPPGDLPSGASISNGHYSSNASTPACTVTERVSASSSGYFGVSFWIRGECPTECTVLDVGTLTVTLRTSSVRLNSITIGTVDTTNWLHVVVTKRSGSTPDVYVNGTKVTFTRTTTITSATATLGSTTALTGSNNYMVVDARFYNDGLTDREISSLSTGTFRSDVLFADCRCPISSPVLSSDGLKCSGTRTVGRLEKIFHTLQDVVDNSTYNWASQATNNVITIDLGNTFQVEQVSVTFSSAGSMPLAATWMFDNTAVDTALYTCNFTSCVGSSFTSLSRDQFAKTIAQTLKLTITRGSSTSRSNYIVEDIVVSGRCDCDGSATACTWAPGSPSYTCSCSQRTSGGNCKTCENAYYRDASEFGCFKQCGCDTRGVDQTDQCESVGGKCKCKKYVEGTTCDQCKRLYYNLQNSNDDGCTRTNCTDEGTTANNNTGHCSCRPNVIGVECDRCEQKHYGIQSRTGCTACDCMTSGTLNADDNCNQTSGQCSCKTFVTNRQCDVCQDQYFGLSGSNPRGCTPCDCNLVGSDSAVCNKANGWCPCRRGNFTNRMCDPQVDPPEPGYGPARGGTMVTITGQYLDNNPQVSVQTVAQTITSRSDTELGLRIILGPVGSFPLVIQWGNVGNNSQHQFEYRPNPQVNNGSVPGTVMASRRGGCAVMISGTNLNSVAKPRLVAIFGSSRTNQTVCQHVGSDGQMLKCPSPPTQQISGGSNGTLEISMDGVVDNIPTNVVITPDSDIDDLKYVEFKPPFERKIKITGKNIGADCGQDDYVVYIGEDGYMCTITGFSDQGIECEPPLDPPATATTTGDERTYFIMVKIGTTEITAGKIYYKQFWLTEYFVYIMVGVGLFLILLLVSGICICCCCCRRRRRKQQFVNGDSRTNNTNNRMSEIQLIEHPMDQNEPIGVQNNAYTPEPSSEDVVETEFFLHRVEESIRSKVKDSLIPKRNFNVGNICTAKGSFARLVDGSFTPSSTIMPRQKITIKMLKDPLPQSGVLEARYITALRECLRFKPHKFDHVLSILAIGLEKSKFYIIYPYMEKKTLKDHILETDKNFVLRELLEFIVQVAEGMDFLADKNLVHKDVATRNCMIDVKNTVKIGDAAFSWDFHPVEYMYDGQKDRYLPVRWMALESLQTGFYDTKTDVWSFGVLIWEVLTRGILPFTELNNEDLQAYIEAGYRLGKPHQTSDELYELMNSCWQVDSDYRPTFHQIITMIGSSMDNRQSTNEDLYINTEVTDSVYINQDEVTRLRELSQSRRGR